MTSRITRIAAVLSGCLLLDAVAGASADDATVRQEVCPRDDVLLPAEARSGSVLFGEMHGSVEAPAFFLGAVCSPLRDRSVPAVVVGLEFPLEQSEPIAAYLDSAGRPADGTALLSTAFWRRSEQDGRTSAAMFELVEGLRVLSHADSRLQVAVFDDRSGDARGERERMMARAWQKSRAAHPGAMSLALTGNLHARRTAGFAGDPAYRPMAMHLDGPVATYAFRGNGGRIWACMADGCGIHDQPGRDDAASTPDWRMERVVPSQNYDGLVDLGPYSPSPPAVAVYGTHTQPGD